MLANGLVKLWGNLKGKPAPDELSERLTKVEVAQIDHSRRLKALEQNDKDLRELILAENGKIYDRLKEIAEDLYSLTGKVDVLVCDGFSGNILLKSVEGTARFLMKEVKKVFMKRLSLHLS